MKTLKTLEEALLTKRVDIIPDTYSDEIDVQTLKSEFVLFKEKLSHPSDAVRALQNMHPVRNKAKNCTFIKYIALSFSKKHNSITNEQLYTGI